MSASKSSYRGAKKWADQFEPAIKEILRQHAHKLIDVGVRTATRDEDIACDADLVITISSGDVLCRVRENKYNNTYRDYTVRWSRDTGARTEAEKIRAGSGRWYFYGWLDEQEQSFIEWMIIDLNNVRADGMLTPGRYPVQSNGDGTYFIPIEQDDLRKINAIVAHSPPPVVIPTGKLPTAAPAGRPQFGDPAWATWMKQESRRKH